MTREKWPLLLRKCRTPENLERVIEHWKYSEKYELDTEAFNFAADHRLAELTVNRFFDKVPASIWELIK